MHPQGHLVSNISLSCVYIRPQTTSEGERYMAADSILFNDNLHRHVWMPPTFLHALDSSSPLGNHAADIKAAPGFLLLLVQGFDETLKTSICNRARYVLAETAYGRWCDIITRSPNLPRTQEQPKLPWRLSMRRIVPSESILSLSCIDIACLSIAVSQYHRISVPWYRSTVVPSYLIARPASSGPSASAPPR